jgi:hypothetical protein
LGLALNLSADPFARPVENSPHTAADCPALAFASAGAGIFMASWVVDWVSLRWSLADSHLALFPRLIASWRAGIPFGMFH